MPCSVVRDVIDLEGLRLRSQDPQAGAVIIFYGDVRNHSQQQQVSFLEYEAHESMALKQITRVVEEAQQKWELHTVEVIHRLGKLAVKECSIAIAVSSSHRGEAYAASRYIIDTIKHAVPIWKKEHFVDGASEWSKGCEACSVVEETAVPPAVVENEDL
ncbi:MAG: molybdenum cofactor biosynthesis protein MoaE [SAR324 cluster bacterium]|nr:molybdenum cofactor biosynthesis protein MoaE [SAR324 cluster bacterium]MBL7036086.1 molybdenum cofactor biosynthesis protein MoaE [SAR324 cluster bacterium]